MSREGITTLGELRQWIANRYYLPRETPISVNVSGMEGTGEFTLNYYTATKYKNTPDFPTQERFNEPAEIWIEDV